jgi:hypothetical protein
MAYRLLVSIEVVEFIRAPASKDAGGATMPHSLDWS